MAQTGKKFEFTDEILEEIKTLAGQGLTQEQIAQCIGLHPSTLSEKKSEFPKVAEAIKTGQAAGIQKVTNALYNKAMDGDNVAMIFYLKNRDPDNWRDKVDTHHTGKLTVTAESLLDMANAASLPGSD